jgi:Skp family chaperone for outer membrane proteins
MKIKFIKMKKILPFLCLLLFAVASTNAQQMMKRQNIKLLKTSYITDALNLTQTEAEKFWPIYNSYTDKIHTAKYKLENELFKQINLDGGIEKLSEKQAQELIEKAILLEEDITTNKTKMMRELTKVIPATKVLKLQKAEKDFNRRILQEYGKRKGMQ